MKLHAILVAASLWPGLAAPASLPLDADRACQRLVAAAQTWQLAGAGRCGQYVCERQHQASARHVFALRWRGDGLPARLVGGGRIELFEEFTELGEVRFRGEAQALEAGDRGHQHDVLRPPALRPLQLAKPVRHETPAIPEPASPAGLCYGGEPSAIMINGG